MMQGTQSFRSDVVAVLHADVSGAPRPAMISSSKVAMASDVGEAGEVLLNPRPLDDDLAIEDLLQSELPSPRGNAPNAQGGALLSHREFTGGSAKRVSGSSEEIPRSS